MKEISGVDRDALELCKKLWAVLGEMVQYRGVLSEDEEDLLKALVRYIESMKEGGDGSFGTIEMLRQAAEVMEREEKREYEYSVYPPEVNGVFKYRAGAELKALILKQDGISDSTILRRSVGEWEVVC